MRKLIRQFLDHFLEVGLRGKVRICLLVLLSPAILIELFYCIIDGMIHSTFIMYALWFLAILTMHLHAQSFDTRYKNVSIITITITVSFMILIAWSIAKFNTIEVINVGIGYVYVYVLNNDMYLVSNGREFVRGGNDGQYFNVFSDYLYFPSDGDGNFIGTSRGQSDLYLVNPVNSDHRVIKHYTTEYPELEPKYLEDNILVFDINGKTLAIGTARLQEQYFNPTELNIWDIRCLDIQYKSKNIFGQNGVYQTVEENFYQNR